MVFHKLYFFSSAQYKKAEIEVVLYSPFMYLYIKKLKRIPKKKCFFFFFEKNFIYCYKICECVIHVLDLFIYCFYVCLLFSQYFIVTRRHKRYYVH